MSKVIIVDTETTGASSEDQVIELAYVELFEVPLFRKMDIPYKVETMYSERFQPSVPIKKVALDCHGITFKELLGKRKSEEVQLPKDTSIMIAHNAPFDYRMLGKPEIKTICTLDLSRKMSKFLELEFPNHQLTTLVQVLSPENTELTESKFHSAHGDILKNIIVLQELLKKLPNISSWDELWEFQQSMKVKPKKEKKG